MNRTTRLQQVAAWLCGAGLILTVIAYREIRDQHQPRQPIPADQAPPSPGEGEAHAAPDTDGPLKHSISDTIFGVGVAATLAGLILWFGNSSASRRARWVRDNEDA